MNTENMNVSQKFIGITDELDNIFKNTVLYSDVLGIVKDFVGLNPTHIISKITYNGEVFNNKVEYNINYKVKKSNNNISIIRSTNILSYGRTNINIYFSEDYFDDTKNYKRYIDLRKNGEILHFNNFTKSEKKYCQNILKKLYEKRGEYLCIKDFKEKGVISTGHLFKRVLYYLSESGLINFRMKRHLQFTFL